MHVNIAQLPGGQRPPGRRSARGVGGIVYRSVRLISGGIGHLLDAALARLLPPLGAKPSSAGREAALAAVNGVLGDYLEQTRNPLAIVMSLRRDGRPLVLERNALQAAIERPGKRLLVAVHGLCMNDLQWSRAGHDHAQARRATRRPG